MLEDSIKLYCNEARGNGCGPNLRKSSESRLAPGLEIGTLALENGIGMAYSNLAANHISCTIDFPKRTPGVQRQNYGLAPPMSSANQPVQPGARKQVAGHFPQCRLTGVQALFPAFASW